MLDIQVIDDPAAATLAKEVWRAIATGPGIPPLSGAIATRCLIT